MYQKLQYNFDVIQYLVKNASPEQLIWRKDDTSWSLEQIVCHLRDVELLHNAARMDKVLSPATAKKQAVPGPLKTKISRTRGVWNAAKNPSVSCEMNTFGIEPLAVNKQVLQEYAHYRRQTIARFQNLDTFQYQGQVTHQLFGKITLAELVTKIDKYDQTYIRHIEEIVHTMPLNPLLARAVYEIDQYYQRYRSYLAGATSILDIGVGPGLALRYVMLQNPDLRFAGVDVRDLRLSDVEVPLQVYDGHTLPFVADEFDVSLLFYMLHHCQDPRRVLAEAVRVTRRTLIIIEEFDRPDADAASLDLTERQSHQALGLPTDMFYQLFDKAELETMFKEESLIELEQQPLPSETTRPVQKYLYVMGVRKYKIEI